MRFSKRINFDANCKMEFHKFPLDVQVCTVKFESWSYSNEQIKFEWVTENCTVQIGTRLYQGPMMGGAHVHTSTRRQHAAHHNGLVIRNNRRSPFGAFGGFGLGLPGFGMGFSSLGFDDFDGGFGKFILY